MSATPTATSTGQAIAAELELLRELDQSFTARVGEEKPERWKAIWQSVEGLKCFSTQPDGVPCASLEIDCENCDELLSSLQRWRRELEEILEQAARA